MRSSRLSEVSAGAERVAVEDVLAHVDSPYWREVADQQGLATPTQPPVHVTELHCCREILWYHYT